MNRRRLIVVAIAAAIAGTGNAKAQSPRAFRIGIILEGGAYFAAVDGLREGLKQLGLDERKHYVFEIRDTKGDLAAVETAARSLEAEKVDLIYALTVSVTIPAKQATTSVPIVFYSGADPIANGLVSSLNKPGGRLTGFHGRFVDLMEKRLQLLKEIIPGLRRILIFYNPEHPSIRVSVEEMRAAAVKLNLTLVERHVASVAELRDGLKALRAGEFDAYVYAGDAMVGSQSQSIIEAANAIKLPTLFPQLERAREGALITYGPSYFEIGRLSARYIQRISLGAKPGDLPVEQYDRVHLVINLKAANALGLTIPEAILVRADEIIE